MTKATVVRLMRIKSLSVKKNLLSIILAANVLFALLSVSTNSTAASPLQHAQAAGTKPILSVTFHRDTLQMIALDGFTMAFDNSYSNNYVLGEDASKLMGSYENIFTWRGGASMSIDKRKLPGVFDTVHIRTTGLVASNYRITFLPKNFNLPGIAVYVHDDYNGVETEISATDTTFFTFHVTSDSLTKAADRFHLLFRAQSSLLPLDLISFNSSRQNKTARISWVTLNETGVSNYLVQRSIDGEKFETIGGVEAKNSSSNSYIFVDDEMPDGSCFYRLQIVDMNGEISYSNVLKIKGVGVVQVKLFPNPAYTKKCYLDLSNCLPGTYQVDIYNAVGQQIQRSIVIHQQPTENHLLNLPSNMLPGTYFVKVKSGSKAYSLSLLVR